MIEVLPGFPGGVIGVRCADYVTREDFEAVLIPTLNAALKQHQTLHVYLQIDSFTGMSPGALWDDLKLAWEHYTHRGTGRIAIVTDLVWISHTVKLFAFLMPWEPRLFPLADAEKARAWIAAPEAAPAPHTHPPVRGE
jgi:hypothetical protein